MVRHHFFAHEVGERVEDGERRLVHVGIAAARALQHEGQQLGPPILLVRVEQVDAQLADGIAYLLANVLFRLALDAREQV